MRGGNLHDCDKACAMIREGLQADCVVLIVLGGDLGDSVSLQGISGVAGRLPDALEALARRIRQDLGEDATPWR